MQGFLGAWELRMRECGVHCGDGQSQGMCDLLHAPASSAPSKNTLSFHEDRSSRRFDAALTEHAMASLGDLFGELLVQRGHIRVPPTARTQIRDPQLLDAQAEIPLRHLRRKTTLLRLERTTTQLFDKNRL